MGVAEAILDLVGEGRAPQAAWLDGGGQGRGFFGAFPDVVVEGDDLRLLDGVERLWRRRPEVPWIGWLTYDLGADTVLERTPRAHALPGLCLRRYPGALELRGDATIEHGDRRAITRLLGALRGHGTPSPSWPWTPLRAQLRPEVYRRRVQGVLEHIRAGDTYQVNLSQRFVAHWDDGDTRDVPSKVAAAYADLRRRSPATMGALLGHRLGWIVSNSPETLVDLRFGGASVGGDMLRSWPIKGTRPRATTATEDAELARQLRTSVKDAAEHVMIVDLVRNDLGCVAVPGTVSADPAPRLVTLPTVHHLVTEVRATVRPDVSLRELVMALFPGGSITGAPKRRTVELIDALEVEPRGIYCGSIVVLEPGGLRMSIAIRTGMVEATGLIVPGGGGIVLDSDPEAERLETIAKTRAFDPRRGWSP